MCNTWNSSPDHHCFAKLPSTVWLPKGFRRLFRSGDRECPPDLKEAVASLIYAAPRCADKEQLLQARKLLAKKFYAVAAAADSLAPNCEVHPTVSFLTASGDPSTFPKVEIVAPFLPLFVCTTEHSGPCSSDFVRADQGWLPGSSAHPSAAGEGTGGDRQGVQNQLESPPSRKSGERDRWHLQAHPSKLNAARVAFISRATS